MLRLGLIFAPANACHLSICINFFVTQSWVISPWVKLESYMVIMSNSSGSNSLGLNCFIIEILNLI